MERRRLLPLIAAAVLATGCSAQDDTAEAAKPASSDGARQAVETYVRALNSRNITALIAVGGVKDEAWSRKEAAQILAERGGRGWTIKDLQIDHDMGPDTGSARLVAEDGAGESLRDTFTVTRENGAWHLVVFTAQPAEAGKEAAATDRPSS